MGKQIRHGKIKERAADSNWMIYILKLENDKFYVGLALDPMQRFEVHFNQEKGAAKWCKLHKPIKILKTIDSDTKYLYEATLKEDKITRAYISEYGLENVRGGRYLGSDNNVKRKYNGWIKSNN